MRIRDLFSKFSRLIRYYETKKTTGAPAPAAPASLAPMYIIHLITIYTLFLTSYILLAELISSCCITPPMIRLLIMQPLVEFSWYVSKFANEANRDLLVTQQSQKLWESIHGEWILACLIRKKHYLYFELYYKIFSTFLLRCSKTLTKNNKSKCITFFSDQTLSWKLWQDHHNNPWKNH